MSRKCTPEKQRGNLDYEGKRLYHDVELPGHNHIQFALTVPASISTRSSRFCRCASTEPLLAEYGDEGGERSCSETRILNDRARWAGSLWELGNGAWRRVVDRVNENLEELDGLFIGVRLELRLHIDNECGSYGRETPY